MSAAECNPPKVSIHRTPVMQGIVRVGVKENTAVKEKDRKLQSGWG